jgi:uncharacterized protein YcbK (DUF882 family)
VPKGTQLSPHFNEDEFRCKCCGEVIPISPALIELLEDIREFSGFPIIITSGYRCPSHNAAVGGKPNSAHVTAEAADFAFHSSHELFKYLEAIFLYGPQRLGISFKGKFIHVDVSIGLPQEVVWGYDE